MKPHPLTNINDPRWARAIAHPLRIRLLAMLNEEPASPVMLATKLEQPLGVVSYHVRKLHDLGLLDLVSTRPRRGATEHFYRARGLPVVTDEAWSQLGTVPKQRMITVTLNQIHDYAMRSAAAGGFDAADANFSRVPLNLDQKGWAELAAATKRWLDEAGRIEEEASKRSERDQQAELTVGLVILLFEALPFSGLPSSSSDGHQQHRKSARSKAAAPERARLG